LEAIESIERDIRGPKNIAEGKMNITAIRRFINPVLILIVAAFWTVSLAEINTNEYTIQKSSDCLACHEEKAKSLSQSPHAISSEETMKSSIPIGCVSCHSGWEKHLEDPSSETIAKFSSQPHSEQAQICGKCHNNPHQAGMVTADPHFKAGLSCNSCHEIHARDGLSKETSCLNCHEETRNEFKRRSAHPLESGNINCVDCHQLSALRDPALSRGIDWTCQNCHSDKAGPYLYEHPVAYSHLVNGGGCVECHEPHGSQNNRLLKRQGNSLCLQCHETPPGHRTAHSGWGMKADCVYCHSDIHGSYDNRKFLDPNLSSRFVADCYQSGCHSAAN
jgi:DmsE family decaheme c-type cytochrome